MVWRENQRYALMKLIEARTPPAEAAKQLGLGRSTVYREMRRLGISYAAPARRAVAVEAPTRGERCRRAVEDRRSRNTG
ncbi:helix-turn-helix domain-containing protein [Mesorhizobium sp.]|uniref:helix-turn-helix domain-containing protein n=1 Tax=Mesorhizobium sp. TaxID=1871066 RepID=UPI00338F69EA